VSEKKLLAVLSLVLALIGGGLVLLGVFNVSNLGSIDLDYLTTRAAELILGIGAILFALYTFKGHTSTGGLLTIVVGVLILVEAQRIGLAGTLVLLGGVLSIITAEARSSGSSAFGS